MDLEPSFLRDWAGPAALVVTAINSVVMFLRKPGEAALAAVEQMQVAVQDHRHAIELRVQQLETHVEHLPTASEISELRGEMHSLQAQMGGLHELLRRIENQTTLINQHLLNQNK